MGWDLHGRCHGFGKTIGVYDIGIQLVSAGFHGWQGQLKYAASGHFRMQVVDHIQTFFANGVQVHEMVVVGNEIIDCAHKECRTQVQGLFVFRFEPATVGHDELQGAIII